MLPAMRTDIHLKKETEHVIVDTKFYREALQAYHGKSSIHSEHLYQLFSYLKNAEALGDEYSRAKGVLLYPAVGERFPLRRWCKATKCRLEQSISTNLGKAFELIC